MRMLGSACVLFLVPGLIIGEETYTLKVPTSAQVGEKARITAKNVQSQVVAVSGNDGAVLHEEKREFDRTATYIQETLAREKGKKASKLSITFEKVDQSIKGEKQKLDLDGKTVIIEFRNKVGSYTAKDGSELGMTAMEYLRDAFKRDRDNDDRFEMAMFPKKPVKVGESWEGDLAEIARQLGENDAPLKLDLKKCKATGKLLKTYEKDGRPFAVIEIDMDMALLEMGGEDRTVKLNPGSNFRAKGTIDLAIDGGREHGTLTMTVTMNMDGKLTSPDGMELGVKLTFISKDSKTGVPIIEK